jgi:hypothetical protein
VVIVLTTTILCAYLPEKPGCDVVMLSRLGIGWGALFGPLALIAVWLLPSPQNKAAA